MENHELRRHKIVSDTCLRSVQNSLRDPRSHELLKHLTMPCALKTPRICDSLSYFIIFVASPLLSTVNYKFFCVAASILRCQRDMLAATSKFQHDVFLSLLLFVGSSAKRNDEDDGLINNMSNADEKNSSWLFFSITLISLILNRFIFVSCFAGRFVQPSAAIANKPLTGRIRKFIIYEAMFAENGVVQRHTFHTTKRAVQ